MNRFLPNVPSSCKVVGRLYGPDDTELLNSNMLEVKCYVGDPRQDVLICAGWYPEEDPSGSYYVVAYRGLDEIEGSWHSTDPAAVIAEVERLAQKYEPRVVSIPEAIVKAAGRIHASKAEKPGTTKLGMTSGQTIIIDRTLADLSRYRLVDRMNPAKPIGGLAKARVVRAVNRPAAVLLN